MRHAFLSACAPLALSTLFGCNSLPKDAPTVVAGAKALKEDISKMSSTFPQPGSSLPACSSAQSPIFIGHHDVRAAASDASKTPNDGVEPAGDRDETYLPNVARDLGRFLDEESGGKLTEYSVNAMRFKLSKLDGREFVVVRITKSQLPTAQGEASFVGGFAEGAIAVYSSSSHSYTCTSPLKATSSSEFKKLAGQSTEDVAKANLAVNVTKAAKAAVAAPAGK